MVENYINKQEIITKKTIDEINFIEKEYLEIKNKYTKKHNNLNLLLDRIKNTKYLDFDDSTNAIRYLVSLIEDKTYLLKTTKIPIKKGYIASYLSNSISINNIYNLLYLVEKDKVEYAYDEIKNKFKEINNIKYLENKNNNYIQLTYYKDNNTNLIYYLDQFDNSNNIKSQIVDSKYYYIYDYINSVLNYKLEVIDLGIGYEEMKVLATKFVYDFKEKVKTLKK